MAVSTLEFKLGAFRHLGDGHSGGGGMDGDDPVGGRGPNWNSRASQKSRYHSSGGAQCSVSVTQGHTHYKSVTSPI